MASTAEIWLLDLAWAREQGLHHDWWRLLDAEERARAERLRDQAARERFVLSHGLLRLALSRWAPVPPKIWRFRPDEYGRPVIATPKDMGIIFSLSRSPGLAAVLVDDQPRGGLDVERIGRVKDPLMVARGWFNLEDLARLEALEGRERDLCFTRLWALKEATVKALHQGMAMPLKDVWIDLDDPSRPVVHNAPRIASPTTWHAELHHPTADHVLAVTLGNYQRRQVDLLWWTEPHRERDG